MLQLNVNFVFFFCIKEIYSIRYFTRIEELWKSCWFLWILKYRELFYSNYRRRSSSEVDNVDFKNHWFNFTNWKKILNFACSNWSYNFFVRVRVLKCHELFHSNYYYRRLSLKFSEIIQFHAYTSLISFYYFNYASTLSILSIRITFMNEPYLPKLYFPFEQRTVKIYRDINRKVINKTTAIDYDVRDFVEADSFQNLKKKKINI